jgi:hypothetical protein
MWKMLFSIPERGWLLIAVAATAFFVVSLRALFKATTLMLPDELRRALLRQQERRWWVWYLIVLLQAAILLGGNLLPPEPLSELMFLYVVSFTSIPIALFPVRRRIVKDYIAQQENPDIVIKPDRIAMVWIVGFLSTVVLVAVLAVMTTRYDMLN